MVIATSASLALSLMTRAYQIAKTGYAAINEYAYLLSVEIFGWMFWNITPDLISLAGIICIMVAGIVILLAQRDMS